LKKEPIVMQGYATELSQESKPLSAPLVERVDSSIGEASTMIGAMLTEFMRRTLRNGVIKIDEEMNAFVGEKVDATIAERTPALEQHAAEVAENAARSAATEVAVQEVTVLREKTDETARHLEGRIDATDKKVGTTAEEITQQVQDLWQRSREGAASFKARLKELEASSEQDKAELKRLRDHYETSRRKLEELAGTNEALVARIIELEKPRGLRALWARLFGRRKKAA
jgi:chromosome segregation ATPase